MNRYVFHVDPANSSDNRSELQIQAEFRNSVRKLAPGILLVAIPNAGKRTAWEKVQRAKEGLLPGFPDMQAMYDGRVVCLEFKTGRGSIETNQIECLNKLVRMNFAVGVFRRPETALEWLKGHFPDAFQQELAA